MAHTKSVGEILTNLQSVKGETISAGQIMGQVSDASYPLVLLTMALVIIAIPVPILPPFNFLFGLPFSYLGWQILRGHDNPALPLWLAKKEFNSRKVRATAAKMREIVAKFESWAKPSMTGVAHSNFVLRLIGITVSILSLSIFLPLPFTTSCPCVLIAIMALGRIHEDGRLVLGGIIGSAIWMTLIFGAIAEAGDEIFDLYEYFEKFFA